MRANERITPPAVRHGAAAEPRARAARDDRLAAIAAIFTIALTSRVERGKSDRRRHSAVGVRVEGIDREIFGLGLYRVRPSASTSRSRSIVLAFDAKGATLTIMRRHDCIVAHHVAVLSLVL